MNCAHRYRPQARSACFNKELSALQMEFIDGWAAPRWTRRETLLSATARRAVRFIQRSVTQAERPVVLQVRWEPRPACSKALALRPGVFRDGETILRCASIRAMTVRSGTLTNISPLMARSTGGRSSVPLDSPDAAQDPTSPSRRRRRHKRYCKETVRATQ